MKGAQRLGMRRHKSLPGVPKSNAVVERLNHEISRWSRCALAAAGLPCCFWPWAAETSCLLHNTEILEKVGDEEVGLSQWAKTHGAEFEGYRIPLGCKVR